MTDDKEGLFWHRVKFLSFIAVFLAPFIAGWLALYVFELRPESGNYGALIQPVKKLDWPELKSTNGQVYEKGFGRKWTFLLISRDGCEAQCQSNLFYMRQIRTLLGRDTERLQNVLISTQAVNAELQTFLTEYPDLAVIEDFENRELFSQLDVDDNVAVGATPRLYLVDPDQNLMMFYPAENDEHRVLEDIRKLMKLSKIG